MRIKRTIREDLGGHPVWRIDFYRGDFLAFTYIRPTILKPKHRRTRDSTVYLHPSGLWVRAGKQWVERIEWPSSRWYGRNTP